MRASNRNRSSSAGALRPHDPFGGLGSSLLSEFLDRDPFDDPFFTQPFGSSFQGFFAPPQERRLNHQRSSAQQRLQKGHRGPVIEELPDDHDDPNASKSGDEPIVEHPDDDANPENSVHVKNRDVYPKYEIFSSIQPKNICQSYSFSSVTYGGSGGTYYKSSTTRRAGANGVIQEEHEEKDSTGQETKRVSRGLGNKGHSVTRNRNAEGSEKFLETLHNLREEEKNVFDETWRKQAEKYLPGWNRNQGQSLEGDHARSGRHSRAALPSNKESSWRWPWSKHS